jgi:NAD(P)H-dependent flavin oxidoreductase YrpB (nitropropane dioxygenase family)
VSEIAPTRLLAIEQPILAAPMDLRSAASLPPPLTNAGGLGIIGGKAAALIDPQVGTEHRPE